MNTLGFRRMLTSATHRLAHLEEILIDMWVVAGCFVHACCTECLMGLVRKEKEKDEKEAVKNSLSI